MNERLVVLPGLTIARLIRMRAFRNQSGGMEPEDALWKATKSVEDDLMQLRDWQDIVIHRPHRRLFRALMAEAEHGQSGMSVDAEVRLRT